MRTSPQLSSSFLTMAHKWILQTGCLIACLMWIPDALRGDSMGRYMAIIWGVVCAVLLIWSWPIKSVTIEGDFFTISSYFTSHRVPVAHLSRVTEGIVGRPQRITLHFEPRTPFGKRICIIPPQASYAPECPVEVLTFLKGLLNDHKLPGAKVRAS